MSKILFLDLDGTIREPKSSAKFISDPLDQKPIAGAYEQCDRYFNNGWVLIGISNQGGVAAGHKSIESAILEQQETLRLFPQLGHIYIAPDYEGLECYKVLFNSDELIKEYSTEEFGSFRKPGAGMLNLALRFYLPLETLFVGDRAEDEEAAAIAGIDFIWAEDWRNQV